MPWYRAIRPAHPKTATGTTLEPYFAGHGAAHPPKNSRTAMQLTVIMLEYSAMKNDAIRKMMNEKICGNGPRRTFQCQMPPAWLSTSARKLRVLESRSGEAMAMDSGSS